MMDMPRVIDSISLTIDLDFLCGGLRIKPESEYYERLSELVSEAQVIARPKAAYREVTIDKNTIDNISIGGIEFKSRLLMTNLSTAAKLYAYVATCGTELETWAKKYPDFLESYWTDTLMNIALGAAIGALEKRLKPDCEDHFLSSMNPGSLEDWPLTEQRPLFRILGTAPADIGIQLTDSYLLLPLKSLSGIYFDSSENFCNCQLCPRESCTGRRAPRIHEPQK